MNRRKSKNSVLTGYRVLDLTDEKGMFCSRLLADMGAEVIIVEKVGIERGERSFFEANNLGKRSITLNLEAKTGQEIFKQLAKTADVVVENYQPGYLEALGLGYTELSEINPQLIMASITSFGQDGPYRAHKADDLVASALGGQMYTCGEPQLPPLKPFGRQAYYLAGLFAANGILLALWHRHTSGKGQYIDISIQDCVAASLDHVLVRYFYEGKVAKRQGSLHWNNAFRIFPCHDGYILLSLFQHWETLVEWLDDEGMAEDLTDKKWLNRERRLEQLEHIIEVLERWTRSHTAAELVEKGQLMRFPWAEVSSIPGLMDNPQLKERGFFVELEHPESGKRVKFPGAPCKLSRSPWRVGSRIAVPGENNMAVYPRDLGLSEKDIEALTKEGVI